MPAQVLFAGTPEFAVPCLRRLASSVDVSVVAVLTQPDRHQGRGRRIVEPPVKKCAQEFGLKVLQFEKLLPDSIDAIRALKPQLAVVAAYGLLLPRDFLDMPQFGCVNIHASLLPRWRGAAPVARAIEAGDTLSGVSIMQVVEELDAGPVYSEVQEEIGADDTTESLQKRLGVLGADSLMECLPGIIGGTAKAVPQPEEGGCYAKRLRTSESAIDWLLPAAAIERKIRAFNPWPVARTWLENQQLLIWGARIVHSDTSGIEPGTVVEADRKRLVIATGRDCISLQEVQREGRKRMPIANFLAGHLISAGTRAASRPQTA